MTIFCVTESINVAIKRTSGAYVQIVSGDGPVSATLSEYTPLYDLSAAPLRSCSPQTLYFSTPLGFRSIVRAMAAIGRLHTLRALPPASSLDLMRHCTKPRMVGFTGGLQSEFTPLDEQLMPYVSRGTVRLAVLNPFSLAYGDTIRLLTVLRELRQYIQDKSVSLELHLLQNSWNPEILSLCRRAQLIDYFHELPQPLSHLLEYDAVLDFSIANTQDDIPWIDSLLQASGIDYMMVPPENKRNRLEISADVAGELYPYISSARSLKRPILLFHPKASTAIRSFPPGQIAEFLDAILRRTKWLIVSTLPLAYTHERFLNWSPLSKSFEHLIYLISQVDMFISVDTAVYHVADAVDVPGVVILVTHPPEHTLAYYPLIRGFQLHPGNRLSGMSFSECDAERDYAYSLWSELEVDRVLELLYWAKLTKVKVIASDRQSLRTRTRDGAGEMKMS